MSARQKLNTVYISGALFLAAILGGIFQSWLVFLLASATMIVGAIYVGDVRPGRRRRR